MPQQSEQQSGQEGEESLGLEVTVEKIVSEWSNFIGTNEFQLPGSWQGTPSGKVLLDIMAAKGWPSFRQLSVEDKNKLREVFRALEAGELRCVASKTNERDKRALIGDALHKLDLRLILVAKGLEGPEKLRFETWYGSNEHQAEYLSKFLAVQKPTSKSGIHNAGSEFESRYVAEGGFRPTYLLKEFGSDLAEAAIATVRELVA